MHMRDPRSQQQPAGSKPPTVPEDAAPQEHQQADHGYDFLRRLGAPHDAPGARCP